MAPHPHLIVDALAIPLWTRENFVAMQAGGLAAVTLVCSIWEDFGTSFKNLSRLRDLIEINDDLLLLVRGVDDIDRARESGKTGIIIGWQNSVGFADYLPFVRIFAELGLRVVQITFNTANSAGSGCYESSDGGLTDFGRELVATLNANGVALDLTHLGDRTARDVIAASTRPLLYSHTCPRQLRSHFRNKTDEDMQLVAERGGVVAVCTLPHYLPRGLDSTVDDMATAIVHVLHVTGSEGVAIGTDLTPGQPGAFMDFVSRDKGNGRSLIDYSTPPVLRGMSSFADYGNIVSALERRSVPSSVIDKIMGQNLRRFFADAWVPAG